MRSIVSARKISFVNWIVFVAIAALAATEPAWDRFRGPNGAGVSEAKDLPDFVDVDKNLLWKLQTPPGYSAPVIGGGRLFLTGHETGNLFTIAGDRATGRQLWKQPAPKSLDGKPKGPNSPVSPTPVTDGNNVYAFFASYAHRMLTSRRLRRSGSKT